MVVVKGSNLLQHKTIHFLNKLKDCPLYEGPACTNGPKFMHYTDLAMYYYHLHLYPTCNWNIYISELFGC